jgi:hypothetical protein
MLLKIKREEMKEKSMNHGRSNEMKKTIQAIKIIIFSLIVLTHGSAHSRNAVVASGEASEEMVGAVLNLASASANLSAAGLYLGGSVAIAVGKPIAEVVLRGAEVSMDSVSFSADVLADGLITTAQLSRKLAGAGVELSADAVMLSAQATKAGIAISADTAALFLNQAVNIAAASGRLSGEVAGFTAALASAGVELSIDSAKLVANAAKSGIKLSEETAEKIIAACLKISNDCINTAVITERYLLMTLEEANRLLYETSIATIAASKQAGKLTYQFTTETAGKFKELGIDGAKYAKELSIRSAKAGAEATTSAIKGANDATVVVINTGSGLIIASLDTLTASVNEATKKVQNKEKGRI